MLDSVIVRDRQSSKGDKKRRQDRRQNKPLPLNRSVNQFENELLNLERNQLPWEAFGWLPTEEEVARSIVSSVTWSSRPCSLPLFEAVLVCVSN